MEPAAVGTPRTSMIGKAEPGMAERWIAAAAVIPGRAAREVASS